MKSKKCVADLLDGYPVMDALSNIEFYKQGVIDRPVAAINHIQPFIDEKVPDLWAYYCCGQCRGVSNRFFAMPSFRTRCIGFQLFKNDIAGFCTGDTIFIILGVRASLSTRTATVRAIILLRRGTATPFTPLPTAPLTNRCVS